MIIQNKIYSNNNATTFGYRLPKVKIDDIREIKHLNCAICNKQMLTQNENIEIIDSLKISGKNVLQSNKLKDLARLPFLKFLLELANKHPKKTLLDISKTPKYQENIDQYTTNQQKILNHIVQDPKNNVKKANFVVNKLYKYRENMQKEMQEVFDTLYIYAQKFPNKTLSEILNIPEIAELYNTKANLEYQQLTFSKMQALQKLENIGKSLPIEEQQDFFEITKEIKNNNDIKSLQPLVKEVYITSLLEKIFKNTSNATRQEIKNIIKIISQTKETPYKILQTLRTKNDIEIITYLVKSMEISFEHVKAKSSGGSNSKRNGIFLCRDCNRKKGQIPYRNILDICPDFQKNEQKQINKITTYITHNVLRHHKFYPIEIKTTLYEESDHNIALNTPQKYIKDLNAEIEKNIEIQQIHITKLLQKIQNNVLSTIDPNKKNSNPIKSIHSLKTEQNKILNQIKKLSEILFTLKEEKIRLQNSENLKQNKNI